MSSELSLLRIKWRIGSSAVYEGVFGNESDNAVVFNIDEGRMAIDDRNAEVVVEAEFERSWLEIAIPVGYPFTEAQMPLPDTSCSACSVS